MKKLLVVVLILGTLDIFAFKPRRVFNRKCSKCHTVSEGPKKGPDLKGLSKKYKTSWIVQYLQMGKADLLVHKKIVKRKHPVDLSFIESSDLHMLVEYIEAKGAGSDNDIASGLGNIKAGRILSTNCTTCHGIRGRSGDISMPNIAGQHRLYMVKQLKAFRSGYREDPKGNMNEVTQKLSERDLVNIATYYSAQ